MKSLELMTERLLLKPITHDMVKALIEGRFDELEKSGLHTEGKWPTEETLEFLPIVEERMRHYDEPNGYDVWIVIRKDEMRIIGDLGFKGAPDAARDARGSIEIGYGIIEAERRKGYCYEAVKALIDWAFLQNEVKRVKADCLIDNIGSIRILQKCGFQEISRDDVLIFGRLKNEARRTFSK